VDEGRSLQIIDISDPASSREAGYYHTPGEARNVTVSRNYIYFTDYGAGFKIYEFEL
jgi:hypothetical protein